MAEATFLGHSRTAAALSQVKAPQWSTTLAPVCRHRSSRSLQHSTVAKLKRQRLSDIVASLTSVDKSFEDMYAALEGIPSSSSSSSSESEEEQRPSAVATAPRPALEAAGPAEPPSPDALRLERALELSPSTSYGDAAAGQYFTEQATPRQIRVCTGKACSKSGAVELLVAAKGAAQGSNFEVTPCKCLDKCKQGPNVQVRDAGHKPRVMTGVHAGDMARILYG